MENFFSFEESFDIFLSNLKNKSIELKAMPLKEEKVQKILDILKDNFKEKEISYLEVGSGIGYSFLRLLKELNIKKAVLIEKDKERFKELQNNLKILKNTQINLQLVNEDALEFLKNLEESFDLALVDANKSKYLEYFLLLKNKVKVLIFDNTFFNNLNKNKRFKTIIKNLENFHFNILKENFKELFHFKIGDGITVIIF
jgi:predicted O-methyltransferase YrrM